MIALMALAYILTLWAAILAWRWADNQAIATVINL